MEVYQIRVFLEVAKHLSFTEAASVLNLTQPAVSAKIKSLETELGTALFHRLGRKVQLTEVGLFLLEAGATLIEAENQLLQKIREIKTGKFDCLKIGCTAALADTWLPEVLFKYRQQYPELQMQCLPFNSIESLYRAVVEKQVDLGVSEIGFEETSTVSTTPIDSVQYGLVLSAVHPLATCNWLALADLKSYPWVLLPPGSTNRLVLATRLAELNLSLADFSQLETVTTNGLLRTYMVEGNYLSFVSSLEFKWERQSKLLTFIPIQEFALPNPIFLLSLNHSCPSEGVSIHPFPRHLKYTSPAQIFADFIQSLSLAPTPVDQSRPFQQNFDRSQPLCLKSPQFTLQPALCHRTETLTISIGVQNSTIAVVTAGLIIQRLGLLEHFLPRQRRYSGIQYQIQWCNFSAGAPILEGLHSGMLDIGILGDYPLLLSATAQKHIAEQAKQTCLVSFVSSNPDGSCNAVVVPSHSQFQSIEDLQGRTIAVPFNTLAHGRVIRLLKTTNLLTDIQLEFPKHIDPAHLLEQPIHLADGYAHFAPFHDIACRTGKFRYIRGNELENLPSFYGVVVSNTLAEQHPEIVMAYLRALAAAQYWYDTTPSAINLVSQWTQVEPGIISQLLSSSYQANNAGRFFSEMKMRSDWLNLHLAQLSSISGNEYLQSIDLDRWLQPEFLQCISNHN